MPSAKTHGRLAAVTPAATTDTTLYSPASGRKATGILSVCNKNATAVHVRVMHIDGNLAALSAEDYLEYDATIAPNGVLERSGIAIAPTHTIAVRSDTTAVAFVLSGVEEDA
jgi:hypothetical protein